MNSSNDSFQARSIKEGGGAGGPGPPLFLQERFFLNLHIKIELLLWSCHPPPPLFWKYMYLKKISMKIRKLRVKIKLQVDYATTHPPFWIFMILDFGKLFLLFFFCLSRFLYEPPPYFQKRCYVLLYMQIDSHFVISEEFCTIIVID